MMLMRALVLMLLLPVQGEGRPAEDSAKPAALERARAEVIRSALESIERSIVTIETIGGAQPLGEGEDGGAAEEGFRLAEGPTTGIVLSEDGFILTSSFNFAREPTVIMATRADGKRCVAKLLGRDYIRRLALLKIETEGLIPAPWIPGGELAVGLDAIACGRGLGGRQSAISVGIISAVGRRNGNAIQTDAKSSPANYGGPLIDLEGRVYGVLVPLAGAGRALAGAEWYDSGIGFAITRDKVNAVLERLKSGETIEPGRLGVTLEPEEPSPVPWLDELLPSSGGAQIKEIVRPSPAWKAKLKPGDWIVGLDGLAVGSSRELQRRLSDRAAGEEVTLRVKRRWRVFDVKIRLDRSAEIGRNAPAGEERPDPEDEAPGSEPESE